MSYTKEQIEKAVKSKGHVWFEGAKDYDLNIVGVRNSSTGNAVTNVFDDSITVSFKENGAWQFKQYPITTDPGTKAVKEFHNVNGVARLVPGQYRSSHTIGLHQGKYEALRQQKPVKVYRDKNKDMQFDENTIQEGIFGINIHRSNPKTESTYVENWSEGCQVFKRVKDFDEFMEICRKGRDAFSNSFTYTLIQSKDIVA
tara:strand:+ start:101 stop:700 length:600 start_codon:yes stop_codon:yes gene_type:complete